MNCFIINFIKFLIETLFIYKNFDTNRTSFLGKLIIGFDKVDYEAIHFLAFNSQGAPVGTCRIFNKDDKSVFYLGRLAVLKSYRGLKIGSALICQCENVARNLGASEIRLHSQYRAKNFYQKCGYTEYGEIEDEEGCPHIWMKKNIGE